MFHRVLLVCILCAAVASFLVLGFRPAPESPVVFQESFDQGGLDSNRWEIIMDGDFAEVVVDVYDADPGVDNDYRLRLQANTVGTSDPLKFLGIRSRKEFDLSNGRAVSFDLDWNDQSNGCYLTASLYLCPVISDNPKNEGNWLKFEYTGVPPGRNVRINIWQKTDGVIEELLTDWGPTDEQGRPIGKLLEIGNQGIELLLEENNLQVFENNKEVLRRSDYELSFTTSYIYLQMSSGTNYPSRAVYFDNITVRDVITN